jgi:hypothetical protein
MNEASFFVIMPASEPKRVRKDQASVFWDLLIIEELFFD